MLDCAMEHSDHTEFTRPTPTIESTHPDVADFARQSVGDADSDIEKAVRLYYAVRDRIRYDPYQIDLTVDGMKASRALEVAHGWCVSKAVLLAAGCRSLKIPARLGFADVRNHLSTARMRERMVTDIFYWHGYTEILIREKWVKATPAFNIELCRKFRLLPLEFDGENDSLYHPFDMDGHKHMEYVYHRGVYADLPLQEIIATFYEKYPAIRAKVDLKAESFDEDVARETQL